MPYVEKEIEKIYFSIGEVAERFGVATSLIRFWESEFSILHPKKNKKGNRQYTKNDIEILKLIYHLVKDRGFTLNGAKEMLKKDPEELQNKMDTIDSLKNVKKFLIELKDQI